MNPVEDALVRRLDARRAFAKVLQEQGDRNRSILVGHWRSGWTFDEISTSYGISRERVRQICDKGLDRVRQALKERPSPDAVPSRALHEVRPGFDKAAFLQHMRLLIKVRELTEARALEEDAAVIGRLVGRELKPEPPPPKLKPAYVPPPYVPPPPPASAADLAREALNSFMGFRQPTEGGRSSVGERCSTVTFTVSGAPTVGEIDEAMRRLAVEIPQDAILSVQPVSGDIGQTLATVCNAQVAVQALVQWHNSFSGAASYRLAITWDHAPDA